MPPVTAAPGGSASASPLPRWCPSCRRAWPGDREACPRCLAALVDDLEATVVCHHCGRQSPARMQSCPNCLAELHTDPEAAAAAISDALAVGGRLYRPDGVPAFAAGASCTLLRMAPRGRLLYVGPEELIEATVEGRDFRAVPPLRCLDLDGTLLFRLQRYEPLDDALVAVAADGTPLATFLPGPEGGGGFDVRDETSAPIASFRPARRVEADYELVRRDGLLLLTAVRSDAEFDEHIDDQWSLSARPHFSLQPLAGVALALAAKVLLGRPAPVPRSLPEPDDLSNLGEML